MADASKPPAKKRVSLPVVGQSQRPLDGVDTGEGIPSARAPAAWILLGALATFAVLIPLSMLAMALLKAIYASRADSGSIDAGPIAIVSILCVSIASAAGGWIVGRFGGKAGPREGALSGVVAGLVMAGLGALGAPVYLSLVILVVTVPTAWLGARRGRATRKPGDSIGA